MVVTPKEPFRQWILSVDELSRPLELSDVQDDCTAYLIPECLSDEDQVAIINWCWDVIFEQELFSWFEDEDLWPKDRDPAMFLEWFDIAFQTLVLDLVDDIPLEHLEYGAEDDTTSTNGDSNGHGVS